MAPLYIMAPLCSKSTYNLTFWCTCHKLHVCLAAGASIIGGGAASWITERHYYYAGIVTLFTCHKLHVCLAAGASIIGGGAASWITERHYYYAGIVTLLAPTAAACPQWAPKELRMLLALLKNGFHLHLNSPKGVDRWLGFRTRPPPPQ